MVIKGRREVGMVFEGHKIFFKGADGRGWQFKCAER